MMERYNVWHIYNRRLWMNVRILTLDKAPSNGRYSSWNSEALFRRNWGRTCSLHTNYWNSIHCSKSVYMISNSHCFRGYPSTNTVKNPWGNYPYAICVAGAQRGARVLHQRNPVHLSGAPGRTNGYPGCTWTQVSQRGPDVDLDKICKHLVH